MPTPPPKPTPASAALAAPAGEAATPAEAWRRINDALEQMEAQVAQGQGDRAAASLIQAKRLYVQQFQERAISLPFDAHRRAADIFGEAQAALDAGDADSVRGIRLRMDAAMTGIAFLAVEEALEELEVGQVRTWFALMTRKFGLDEKPSPLVILLTESRRNPALLRDVRDRISAGLLLLLVEQVQAGSQAALEGLADGDEGAEEMAEEMAEEALLLYQVVQGRLQEELGEQEEGAVGNGLRRLKEAVGRRDLGEARQAVNLVQRGLEPLSELLELRVKTPTA